MKINIKKFLIKLFKFKNFLQFNKGFEAFNIFDCKRFLGFEIHFNGFFDCYYLFIFI